MNQNRNLWNDVELLFDTGVQVLVLPVSDVWLEEEYGVRGDELALAFRGQWRPSRQHYSIQFKFRRRGADNEIAVAIDTRRGPKGEGYIAEPNARDAAIQVGLPFEKEGNIGSVGLFNLSVVDAATVDDLVQVALCIDLGNSRTTALAIEPPLDDGHMEMRNLKPIRLRSMTDPFAEDDLIFESAFEFRPPVDLEKPVQFKYDFRFNRGTAARFMRLVGKKALFDDEVTRFESSTFQTMSLGAIGEEALNWRMRTKYRSPIQTGVSSPKRYLWSDRPHIAQWSFARRKRGPEGLLPIEGDALKYMEPDDSDGILEKPLMEVVSPASPLDPRHPARFTASMFIYELLLRVGWHLNSHGHRETTDNPRAPRVIRWVTVTFPSVFGPEDQSRLRMQVRKGARLYRSVAARQQNLPDIDVIIEFDEGVASQIFYLDSREKKDAGIEMVAKSVGAAAAKTNTPEGECIASLDIGGGTIDVAVVRYENGRVLGQRLCKVLLVDGARIGGDDLCKELISRIILPSLIAGYGIHDTANALTRLEDAFMGDVAPEQRKLRVQVLRGVLLPLAHKCLAACSDEQTEDELEIRLGDICDQEPIDDLEEILLGKGERSDNLRDVEFLVQVPQIEKAITNFFAPHIGRLVDELAQYNPGTVLLCGRLSGLSAVQKMVRSRLGSASCTVEPFGVDPGVQRRCRGLFAKVSRDPKLSVVLGAALATASRLGFSLKGGPIKIDYSDVYRNYTWGVVDPETNHFSDMPGSILLDGGTDQSVARTLHGRYLIGRRHNSSSLGDVVVEYEIVVRQETDIEFERSFDEENGYERLVARALDPDSNGRVMLRRATVGGRYWLDSGELELEIEMGAEQ